MPDGRKDERPTADHGPGWMQAHVRIGGSYPLIAIRVGALGEHDPEQGTAVAGYAVALAHALVSADTAPVRLEVEVTWRPSEPRGAGGARLIHVRVGAELPDGDAAASARLAEQVLRECMASGAWRLDGQVAVEFTARSPSHPSADRPLSRDPLLPPRQSAWSPENAAPGTPQEARRPAPYPRPEPNAASTSFAAEQRPRVKRPGVHLALPPIRLPRPRVRLRLPRVRVARSALDLARPSLRLALPRPRLALRLSRPRLRVTLPRLRVPRPEVHLTLPTMRLSLPRPQFALPRLGLPLSRVGLWLFAASGLLALALSVVRIGLWDGALPSPTIPEPPTVAGVRVAPSFVAAPTGTTATPEAVAASHEAPQAATPTAPEVDPAPSPDTDLNPKPPSPATNLQATTAGPTGVPLTAGVTGETVSRTVSRTLMDISPTVAVAGAGGLAWPNDPNSTAWFGTDGYHLFARQASQFVALGILAEQRLRNTRVTATFHKAGGPPGGGYGIIVRDQGPGPRDGRNQGGRYYVFAVGDRGEIGIWQRDQDQWTDILPWTPNSAVHIDGGENVLSAVAIGQQLRLEVNGVQVESMADSGLDDGGVGVFVGGDQNHAVLTRLLIQSDG